MAKRKPRKNSDRAVLQQFAEEYVLCEASFCLTGCGRRLEIHHVLGGAHRIDAAWNLVRLCGNCHDWVTRRTMPGRILCWHILDSRGAFEPDTIREAWKQCPLARIERALPEIQEDWIRRRGEVLIEKHSRDQP
jgi:hypothetical protein